MKPKKKTDKLRKDPWAKSVSGGGQFGYYTVSEKFIRVVPCMGKDEIIPIVEDRLDRRLLERVEHMTLNFDSDLFADKTLNPKALDALASVKGMLERKNIQFVLKGEREFVLDDGSTTLTVIQWSTDAPPTDILSNQQTLERLVCDALLKAHPDRLDTLTPWLASLPQKSRDEVKTFAWSHMAGWHAGDGCEAFYSRLWEDEKVVAELIQRLTTCGAWGVAEALAK